MCWASWLAPVLCRFGAFVVGALRFCGGVLSSLSEVSSVVVVAFRNCCLFARFSFVLVSY